MPLELDEKILLTILLKREIGEKFNFKNQDLTKDKIYFYQIMSQLEKMGLINRERIFANGRIKNYTLTDEGFAYALIRKRFKDIPIEFKKIVGRKFFIVLY